MANVDLVTVKEITGTIRELNTDRAWLAGVTATLAVLVLLVLYLCFAINGQQTNAKDNSFCSAKKDTVYVIQIPLNANQDSVSNKMEVSK
jgi:hypothetical protein